MKIIATLMLASQLATGDIYSLAGQDYWDRVGALHVGVEATVRTQLPLPAEWQDVKVYKLTVQP